MISDYLIIIAILLQVISTLATIYYIIKRRRIKSFRYGFLILLVFNIFIAVINLVYPAGLLAGIDLQNTTFPITNFLGSLIILIVLVLDIELVRVFAILNEKITPFILKLFYIFSISMYVGLPFISLIIKWTVPQPWALTYYYYSAQIFSLFGIVVDNSIAFYLPFLVYNYKQSQSKMVPSSMHQTLKRIGTLNLATMVIDWAAFLSCFYVNLVIGDFRIPQDGYYILLAEILLGVHSIFQVLILTSLKELSLAEMEEIPSQLPPATIVLPRDG